MEIDEDACAAHGDCVEAAPKVLRLTTSRHVIGTGDDARSLRRRGLSSTAIRIIDRDTTR